MNKCKDCGWYLKSKRHCGITGKHTMAISGCGKWTDRNAG